MNKDNIKMNSVFKLTPIQYPELEKYKEEAMRELNEFFNIKWVRNTPRIFIVDDRKTIDSLREEKTANTTVGWMWGHSEIFILNPENLTKESRYNAYDYPKLIKHELSHAYFAKIFGISNFRWINEGVAIYTARQLDRWPMPEKLDGFLDGNGVEIMQEAGGAIKLLVDSYGKEKLFEFLEKQKGIKNPNELDQIFKDIFGENLSYQFFNTRLSSTLH